MGFIRQISHRGSDADWANTAEKEGALKTSLDDSKMTSLIDSSYTLGSHQDALPWSFVDEASSSHPFLQSQTSFASISFASLSASAPASGSSQESQKVQQLEQQLQQKDETISQLFRTLEAEEKVQADRIDLLERQLEQLVEMSSGECAGHAKPISSLPPKKDADLAQVSMEVSALQELLTRVIAEKDRLSFVNDNLKNVLQENSSSSSEKSESKSKFPSSIDKMVSMIHKKRKKKGRKEEDEEDEASGDKCQEDDTSEESKPKNKGTSAAQDQYAALYQMTCRSCGMDHCSSHRIKYVGSYTATSHDNARQELAETLESHFTQVWKLMQQQGRRGSASSSSDSGDKDQFASSPLAKHIAKHCKSLSTEEEVLKWCMDNIKVEVQKKGGNRDDRAPPSQKRKKKSQSKGGNKKDGQRTEKR